MKYKIFDEKQSHIYIDSKLKINAFVQELFYSAIRIMRYI